MENKGGITTLGMLPAGPGVETARVEGSACAGGSDLGSTEEGFRGLVDWAGRERGGQAAWEFALKLVRGAQVTGGAAGGGHRRNTSYRVLCTVNTRDLQKRS